MTSSVQTNQQKTTAKAVKVDRSTYRGADVSGDYLWMIDQTQIVARALLIFNDIEEPFHVISRC
jgi:hypothetical protein